MTDLRDSFAVLRILAVAVAANSCSNSSALSEGGVNERWYQTQSGHSRSRPAVLGGLVYFGTGDGHVIARDVNTGLPRWRSRLGSDPIGGANIVVSAGVLVVPVLNYTVGLNAQTGHELWRYQSPKDSTSNSATGESLPGNVVDSRIDADAGSVYIPAWGASISAIDIRSGIPRWIWQPGQMRGDTAASGVFRSGSMGVRLSGDTLFATVWHFVTRLGGVSEAWVVALERVTGRELWRVALPYQGSGVLVEAAPAVYANLIIVHTLSARTYAIDRITRQIVWEFTSPGAHLSTVAEAEVYGDQVYVDGGDEHLYALRASDGSVRWKATFPTQVTRDLLVTDRRITLTNGRNLLVFDRQTGGRVAVVTQPRTSDPLFSSAAAFSNGLLFVTVADAAWCFDEP